MQLMVNALRAYSSIAPGEMGESLYEDRKSLFYGFAVHAESAQQAIEFRHWVIGQIPAASHYVSAWVLADGSEFFSDAKEPHGSAGLPVLSTIKKRKLKDTACVVARVFGGALLGKGGLMRAYTKAASEALDAARIARRIPCLPAEVTVPYPLYEPLRKQLTNWGASVDDERFADVVTLSLWVPVEQAAALEGHVREFTNARATCVFGSEELRFAD